VQLHAQWPWTTGVVVVGNLDEVVEQHPCARGKPHRDLAGLFVAVRTAGLKPRVRRLEVHTCFDDAFRCTLRTSGIVRLPEFCEGLVDRGRLLGVQ
jgi:hypothetical protein